MLQPNPNSYKKSPNRCYLSETFITWYKNYWKCESRSYGIALFSSDSSGHGRVLRARYDWLLSQRLYFQLERKREREGKEGRRAEGGKGERKKCFCHPTDADDNGCSHILCCRFSWSCACHFKWLSAMQLTAFARYFSLNEEYFKWL